MKSFKMLKSIILIIFICVISFFSLVLLDKSSKDGNDKIDDNYANVVDCIEIESPYVTLAFPKEMKDEVNIKVIDDDIYTIEFYGEIKNQEELLMEIIFGQNYEVVGYYSTDSENIPVSVVYYEPDNLDNEDMIYVQKVHMASEHVIDNLCKDENFKLVK